jgi:hypothetical protein
MEKNVYEGFEQVRGRDNTKVKSKLERNLFGYIKNLFHGKR